MLTGASGSMGFETFKQLWDRRDRFDIVLLLRPFSLEKRMFRKYEAEAGIAQTRGERCVEGRGLKIVWGDALDSESVKEACRGIDWCLHVMALISPEADRNPEMAQRVNYLATLSIVEAIEAQDPDHIRMVYVGTVAEYGDRLPPRHVGRTGDPVVPSEFDYYALSKIRAEQAVMQSRIKHRVSLRQTFIMIPGLFSLMDPIMFHQPINSFMESITVSDSGRLMVRCLDVPGDSDFWGGYFNISGGPSCQTTYFEFLIRIYGMLGLDMKAVLERSWFALKNFHMLFYEDASKLNSYLHHWEGGRSQEDYYAGVKKQIPSFLKVNAWFCKHIFMYRWFVQVLTRHTLKKLALQPGGTLRWIVEGDSEKIRAFFGSEEAIRNIPGWDQGMPSLNHDLSFERLDHGYDETKEHLGMEELLTAAVFRGGTLEEAEWMGDMHVKLSWVCCMGHSFKMTPHAVLKGGHWCPECLMPPWNYPEIAKKNKFVAQMFPATQDQEYQKV